MKANVDPAGLEARNLQKERNNPKGHFTSAGPLWVCCAEWLSPSRRREAPCEDTNPPRLFTPGETKALEESKVHQISRAWVTVRVLVGGHPH
jgi:hypothetical protein